MLTNVIKFIAGVNGFRGQIIVDGMDANGKPVSQVFEIPPQRKRGREYITKGT